MVNETLRVQGCDVRDVFDVSFFFRNLFSSSRCPPALLIRPSRSLFFRRRAPRLFPAIDMVSKLQRRSFPIDENFRRMQAKGSATFSNSGVMVVETAGQAVGSVDGQCDSSSRRHSG
jgi:hypothetical protein